MILIAENGNLENKFISPEIPNNFLTKGKFIDNDLSRIQLYDNISDALSSRLGENLEGMVFSVYKPKYLRKDNLIDPEIHDIPYFMNLYGKEHWYLVDLRVEKIGEIRIGRKKEESTYHYGPRQTVAKIYKWSWSEVLEPWEKSKLDMKRRKLFSEKQPRERKKTVWGTGIGAGALMGLGAAKVLEKGLDEEKIDKVTRRAIYKSEGPKKLVARDKEVIDRIEKVAKEGKKVGKFAKSRKGKKIIALGSAALIGGKTIYDYNKKRKDNK